MSEPYDREKWIAEHPDANPVELPTPEKEAAILAEAKNAIANGERYAYSTALGYRAYDATAKASGWFAHAHWVADFLVAQGVAKPFTDSMVELNLELAADFESGPGRTE